MAIAQEDYQETDYSTASSDAEVDRGIASEGMENMEPAVAPEESDTGYDYSAE